MKLIQYSLLCFAFLISMTASSQDVLDAAKKKIANGNFTEAKNDLAKFLSSNPKNKVAFNLSGQARMGLEDFYGAIGDFTYAIEMDTTFADAYNERGFAKMTLGDNEGAIFDFDKAIKFNAKFTEAYTNRGLAKYNIDALEEAYFDFSKALELDPPMQINFLIVAW